ncbi:ZIP family metal transporter [Flavobacteriales bacterium]|nr:ZIP family metal transporter [Flavobacteriales bacterium]
MNEDLSAILLLTVPVVSLGILTVYYQDKLKQFNQYFLQFSGAFLLSVLALHIFPEVYDAASKDGGFLSIKTIGLFVIVGFFVQVFLEFLSQGIEHGHIHVHKRKSFPLGVLISLCVHAFIEGMPLELIIHSDLSENAQNAIIHAHDHGHGHAHHGEGEHSSSLLWGILVHKVPVGITLAMLLIANNTSKIKTLLSLMLFASMAPLGLLLMHFVSHGANISLGYTLEISMAIVMGMLLHIASTILFEADDGHHFNAKKIGIMLLGAVVAYFTL